MQILQDSGHAWRLYMMSSRSYLSVIALVITFVGCLLFFEVTEAWADRNKEASKQNWEE